LQEGQSARSRNVSDGGVRVCEQVPAQRSGVGHWCDISEPRRFDIEDDGFLLGASMGGLLAPRAAAYEHRLAACVAFDGVYDLGLTVTRSMPGPRAESEAVLRAESAPEVDAMIEQLMASDPSIRWAATHGQYVMGVDSPRAFFASYLDYTLADGIAEQITCPTLVCDAATDIFFDGQPQLLFDHLTCRKTLLKFTEEEGAGAHCQTGAQRLAFARIYDWLDDVLAA
jgi:pimeloyl-ACP methyl ester carboxylesterase